MTDPASLTGRRAETPQGRAETRAWLTRADDELQRVAAHPNELLNRLLASGCKVTFSQHEDRQRVTADLTMPDGSHVSETGANGVHALIGAYGSGGYLADLPRLLADTLTLAEGKPGGAVASVLALVKPEVSP